MWTNPPRRLHLDPNRRLLGTGHRELHIRSTSVAYHTQDPLGDQHGRTSDAFHVGRKEPTAQVREGTKTPLHDRGPSGHTRQPRPREPLQRCSLCLPHDHLLGRSEAWRVHGKETRQFQPGTPHETFKFGHGCHGPTRKRSHHNLRSLDKSLKVTRRGTELGSATTIRSRPQAGHAETSRIEQVRQRPASISPSSSRHLPPNVKKCLPHPNSESPQGCWETPTHGSLPQGRRHAGVPPQGSRFFGRTSEREMGE